MNNQSTQTMMTNAVHLLGVNKINMKSYMALRLIFNNNSKKTIKKAKQIYKKAKQF